MPSLEPLERHLYSRIMAPYNGTWEGDFFEEKEVTVYCKVVKEGIVLLTVKARYGKEFVREEKTNEV